MNFTGERVVPDKMSLDPVTYIQHLARYTFALIHCVNKRVLDAACGAGYGMEILSGVAAEVFGIDVSNEALDYAQENYGFFKRCGFLWQLDLEREDFSNNSRLGKLDVITSFETIEHLENPDYFLENVKNSLSNNGLFIFSIPNTNPSAFHKKIFDIESAKQLISKYFKQVEWFGQDIMTIDKIRPDSIFFIGVAKN